MIGPEDLGGHATAWRHWGQGARQVLALHCSLAHAGAWSRLAAALPGVTLTAPDLPGHGRSADWTGARDLHETATGVAIALAERIGAPLDLIGHSFGATIALRVALERPDLLRSLVLIEPVLFSAVRQTAGPEFTDFAAGYAAVNAVIGQDPAQAAALFHGVWGHGRFADLPAAQRDYMTRRMGLVAGQNPVLLEDLPGLTAPGRLESLALPVLLLEGAESPPVIGAIQQVLAARLPHARRQIISGAAHMLPITHAAKVAAQVAAFWAESSCPA